MKNSGAKLFDILNYVEMNHSSDNFSWANIARSIYEIFDVEQEKNFKKNDRKIDCKSGCWNCCCHWVEDVYFFEGEAIYEYLKKHFPERISSIISDSEASVRTMEEIYDHNHNSSDIDLLQEFYKQELPCPLLGSEGKCIAYEVRPITCRSFFSEDRKRFCISPDSSDKSGTYMVGPKLEIEDLLDDLHLKYCEIETTSLRSMLVENSKNEKKI